MATALKSRTETDARKEDSVIFVLISRTRIFTLERSGGRLGKPLVRVSGESFAVACLKLLESVATILERTVLTTIQDWYERAVPNEILFRHDDGGRGAHVAGQYLQVPA
jgi:hypothetical protein